MKPGSLVYIPLFFCAMFGLVFFALGLIVGFVYQAVAEGVEKGRAWAISFRQKDYT